ncbi:hypothetical protein BDW71DRAFT_205375 [Aspergillus fruticulosus]
MHVRHRPEGNTVNSSEGGEVIGDDENDRKEGNHALQALDRQRATLRHQAIVLSRSHIRPITMFDLPIELLRNILDQFRDPAMEQSIIPWQNLGRWHKDLRRENQKTIQNVRLVCRTLNELASPLLCPVLQVNLDQASLDRAVHLSHSSRVASGIRAIRVGLQCFSGELASDLSRFTEFRLSKLREVEDACDWHLERISLAFQDPDNEQAIYDEAGAEQPGRGHREALERGRKICSSWNDYVDRARTEPAPVQVDDEYQEILRTGYEAFCLRHHQQRQMLESQSFVRTLASCMVRMPNARSLGFSDEVELFTKYYHDPALLLDNALLSRLTTTALSWQEVEETEGVHLATARILSDLPIAIHHAGVALTDLDVGLFPCIRDQTLVSPQPHNPALWGNLRAACQSLRRAGFGGSLRNLPIRHSHLAPDDSLHLNEYLAALVSSPDLETVYIYTRAFGLNDGRGGEGEYDLSPVLAAVKWPCIRHLSIMSVGVTQAALEALFAGLGCSVERLHLSSFELLEGRWAGALDIIRGKVRPHATIYWSSSMGGEFGPRKRRNFNDLLDFTGLETPPIFGEVAKYISGVEMKNPLRA